MRKILVLFPVLLFQLVQLNPVWAQGVRVGYIYYSKTDPGKEGYHRLYPNLVLDFDAQEGRALFYDEARFRKDSLHTIAFDRNGMIRDNHAYGQLTDPSGGPVFEDWTCFLDYRQSKASILYRFGTVFIETDTNLPTPQWVLTDQPETEFLGYRIKKAHAWFLGRDWYAWYTDEIPASTGPWLLRGLPGLIIAAMDKEQCFYFKMRYVETLSENRYAKYAHMLEELTQERNAFKHFKYPFEQASRMSTALHKDLKYFDEVSGIPFSESFYYGDDGARHTIESTRPFIPIIPDSYWPTTK